MKNKFILLLIVMISGLGFSVKAQAVKELTTQEFKKLIWNYDENKEWKFIGKKPVIIDLYATWCGPCKRLAPILSEIQQDYGDKLQIYKVDTDKERELARLFNATSIPLMVFIPQKGDPFLLSGLRPKEQLVQIINQNLLAPAPTKKK
ncbi:thioredoxin family protein [Odoribacter lunatus]|uniref:thioredoxin family protein n=1 Tax=Odoribacter lunatus TaxID=2941335 RepID=UPI00203CAFE1|nr:thioredoxin domain-containing protein [Odoribacter lunatus]